MTTNGYRGLCSTCEGRVTCTYPHFEDRPTLFCAEFDWAWHHRMETAARVTPRFTRCETQTADMGKKPSKYKGLCATCIHQAKCEFPKSPDGVWHCEEFA